MRACGVVGWLRIEGEGRMRHCLTEKKKKKNFFKMTKSVGYVTADVDYLITRGGFPIL